MSWKTWTIRQWITWTARLTTRQWVTLLMVGFAYTPSVLRVVALLPALAALRLTTAAVTAVCGAVCAFLWALSCSVSVATVALWAVPLSWRVFLFVARRCRPQYWAGRREEAAFLAWTALSPEAREAVADRLRAVRRSGAALNDQGVRLVEEAQWAMDGRTQGELLARCACHPELEKAARASLKEINQSLGHPKPDTVETMRYLWRAAWRYGEAEKAVALAEARREAYESVSPAERFDKWRKVGMYGGAAAFVLGFLCAYPLQTMVLAGIAAVMAAVTVGAKVVAHLKKLSEPEAKVQPPAKESNHGDRVLRALSDRRQPVRGL